MKSLYFFYFYFNFHFHGGSGDIFNIERLQTESILITGVHYNLFVNNNNNNKIEII